MGESNDEKDQVGLICRRCGCRHFYVVYVRPRPGGRIMRRRECRNCGTRITTWETTNGQNTGS
jgi:transcriptional regulator NrdR family protein